MSGFKMDDYVPVQERVDAFIKAYPQGSLQSEIVELTDNRVTVKALAYRTPDDPRPGIGHSSLGIPGATSFTKGSEIENAETSAWGRAIAALGFEVKRGIASAEEVRNKPSDAARQSLTEDTLRYSIAVALKKRGRDHDYLERVAESIGAGKPATREQLAEMLKLVEEGFDPPIEQPASAPPPAEPQESVPEPQASGGQEASSSGDAPAPPAELTVDQIMEAAGPGAELLPEKPDYVKRAEARAKKAAA